jgi:hypothetical protein
MTTLVPAGPLAGEKPEMLGGGSTVKLPDELAEPFVLVTVIGPVIAPLGTFAVSCASLETENELAVTPPNWTPVVPVKFMPMTVTVVPAPPEPGEKLEIDGGKLEVTLKLAAVWPVPPEVVTAIGTVVAPYGT